MLSVDLAPFGVPKTIEGQLRAARHEGGRFLLLFNETHTDYGIIRQNLLNACVLIDGGFVGCVGVEGDYSFEGWTDEEIEEESRRLFAEHGTDAKMLDFFVQDARDLDRQEPNVPHFFFGTCLKLLRPAVTIRCVEAPALATAADRLQQQLIADAARELNVPVSQILTWLRERDRPEILERKVQEFRNHEVNLQRDEAMLSSLLHLWQETGEDRAAILNGGSAHLDRLAVRLPPETKFVQIFQPV